MLLLIALHFSFYSHICFLSTSARIHTNIQCIRIYIYPSAQSSLCYNVWRIKCSSSELSSITNNNNSNININAMTNMWLRTHTHRKTEEDTSKSKRNSSSSSETQCHIQQQTIPSVLQLLYYNRMQSVSECDSIWMRLRSNERHRCSTANEHTIFFYYLPLPPCVCELFKFPIHSLHSFIYVRSCNRSFI